MFAIVSDCSQTLFKAGKTQHSLLSKTLTLILANGLSHQSSKAISCRTKNALVNPNSDIKSQNYGNYLIKCHN